MVHLGHMLKEDKDIDLAIEAYKHALTLDPNNSDIYVNLGHAHKEDKNIGLAIEAYKHALTLNASDFDIYVNLGHGYKVADDLASAAQAYRKALELIQRAPTLGGSLGIYCRRAALNRSVQRLTCPVGRFI